MGMASLPVPESYQPGTNVSANADHRRAIQAVPPASRTSSAPNIRACANISTIVVRLVVRCQRSSTARETGSRPGRGPDSSSPSMTVPHDQSSPDQPKA